MSTDLTPSDRKEASGRGRQSHSETSPTRSSRPRGRRRSPAASRQTRQAKTKQTVERILAAATKLFLHEGYSNTNLQDVATEAGVTKPTVYSHFRSKEGLLRAVTAAKAETRIAELSEVLCPSDDPRVDLILFGELLLAKVLDPESRLWDRLAAAESLTHPEVGEAFFRAGPAMVLQTLADYFRIQKRQGRLSIPSPERAADQLIGMLLCLDLLRSQVGQPTLGPQQRKRRCREAVDVFLSAYAADRS